MKRKTQRTKPAIPHDGFPLFPHAVGYWAKKIRGKTHYFGSIKDGWEAAEALYHSQREDLHAGREPRVVSDELTVKQLCDKCLTSAEVRVANGEMRKDSWNDSLKTATLFAESMGRQR